MSQLSPVRAANASLTWSPTTDPNVAGYVIYYGGSSVNYTNTVVLGLVTNAVITGLNTGSTYYFAATTYDATGDESPFSNEATYTVPTTTSTLPPTLNSIPNLVVNENAKGQTVNLSGITSGSTNQNLSLTVTATSSNPALVGTPIVTYSSPNSTGSLIFAIGVNASGSATITVTVNNGATSNNIVTQTFTVTVNPKTTLAAISALTINENAAAQTVNLSGITSGTTNQSLALAVTATSSNPALIPAPTVKYSSPSSTGSLILAPVANAIGSATITVTASSSGTGSNQVSQSFLVTVNPVPTLNVISNLSFVENAKGQTVNLSGITSGTTDPSVTLTVSATSSNTAVVGTPVVTYASPNSTGSLILGPVANAVGTSTITVTVANSGAGNNQVSQSFTVTVVSTNAPQITKPLTNIVALVGQTVNMSVTATGQATLKYYWKHNGTKITGSTNNLTLSNVSSASAGTYSVMASNSVGTATSTASLTVVSTTAGNLSQAAQPAAGQFKFTVTGVTGYKYAVQATTDMVNWTSLQTNTAPFVFTDTSSGQFGKRFYRSVYVP